jgi:hypothetical protein
MIANYSAQRCDSDAALVIHLVIYCAVGACFAFALYALLQPSRVSNFGLAAYKPPAGTVLTYGMPLLAETASEPIASVALMEPESTTSVHSSPEPEQTKPTVTARSKPTMAKRPKREDRVQTPKRRIAACIPGYDSSGAQTRPC